MTASNVLPDNTTMLDTSPSSTLTPNALNPGEVIRTSGKFGKPTKIPGKNYSKDEVVIRNADSGKGKEFSLPLLQQTTNDYKQIFIWDFHLIKIGSLRKVISVCIPIWGWENNEIQFFTAGNSFYCARCWWKNYFFFHLLKEEMWIVLKRFLSFNSIKK